MMRVMVLWIGLVMVGCSERVQRENVFASTETGVGLFVSQDARTQLYEGKLGYFRHELFHIPTSKFVAYDKRDEAWVESNDPPGSHDPSKTPQVLAELRVNARTRDGQPVADLYQKLAVGEHAVASEAAACMMSQSPAEPPRLSKHGGGW